MTFSPLNPSSRTNEKNIVISGTNFWNPGDDFVRDGVINILKKLFKDDPLNFLFYNFNEDFFPQSKFRGIHNMLADGDLNKYTPFVDAVVIAGLSAGNEIKDLYSWIIKNGLHDRVYLIGAGYENSSVEKYIYQEPEATIFKNAGVIIGRTAKTPRFIPELKLPYHHLNCPSILAVETVKDIPADKKIERIGFSIQIPHQIGISNQATGEPMYKLALELLNELRDKYKVEIVTHHKTEYFHFLNLLKNRNIPVLFSSFYQDLFHIYPRYDLVISTRLHACLFANGFGIPAIIINDTDRHTHTADGFPHSICINNKASFREKFEKIYKSNLMHIAQQAKEFKDRLMQKYLSVLTGPFGLDTHTLNRQHTSVKVPDSGMPGCSRSENSKSPCLVPRDYQFDSEINEQKLVRKTVKEGMTVFDIGAHLGKYTKLFSLLVGDKGKVCAFEPAESSFKKLAASLKKLNCTNVTLINKAVYSQNCTVVINEFPEEYSSWNSLGRPKMENPTDPKRPVPVEKSVEVQAVTLDSFCQQNNIRKIDYLKLDVEGAELDVLKGAVNLLQNKAIDYVQFEISEKMLQGLNTAAKFIFDFLKSNGYKCHHIEPDGCMGDIAADSNSFYENYIAYPSKTSADKLNVGCGNDYREGFINIDGNPDLPKVDYVLDIKPSVLLEHFEPGTFRYILVKDFLEHHFHWQALKLMKDFYSLLIDEGTLDITLPNVETIINDSSKTITERLWWLYGGQDIQKSGLVNNRDASRDKYPQYYCHKYGWTPDTIKQALLSAGFSSIEVFDQGYNMKIVARRNPELSNKQITDLPVHFFTIVLNGQPFIRHHIEAFKQLPFEWYWHIIEGVADLKHDTAWSVKLGGRISDQLHHDGRSNDGTTEYLDELSKQFPNNITIYRKPAGIFWDGKLEMVNAPLVNIKQDCLLWQVDADELWTTKQISTARDMFIAEPDKTAAYYLDHFFVGENLVTTTIDTYGNNTNYEWLRSWRFKPGFRWAVHEPPRLCMPLADGRGVDIATIKPFKHGQTSAQGLVFQHYAYVTEKQLQFKEIYYGYKNAVEQWSRLQQHKDFPVFLKDSFAWVKDKTQVDTVQSQNIIPLAWKDSHHQWQFSPRPFSATKPTKPTSKRYNSVLFIRPDSIGDNVLAASMLPYVRGKYKDAKITIICQDHIAELYQACPYVDNIITFNRKQILQDQHYRQEILDRLRALKPDLSLNSVFSRDPLADILAVDCNAGQRIAMEGDLSNITAELREKHNQFYTTLLPSAAEHKSELQRHRDFLLGLGIDTSLLKPMIWTAAEDEKFAERFFGDNNLKSRNTIALFPPAQHSGRVYQNYEHILKSFDEFNFLILGGSDAKVLAGKIWETFPDKCHDLTGKTTIRQMAALLRRCRIYLGSESSGAHIACAVGIPNLVILGGGHFGRFMPYSPLTSVVALPLACYGCNWRCGYQKIHCIRDIEPEIITEALWQSLVEPSEKTRVFVQPASLWKSELARPDWKMFDKFLDLDTVQVIPVGQTVSPIEPDHQTDNRQDQPEYLVSAIVSTYNAEKFIKGCLEDLEKQTIADRLEIIVVNSGSQQNEEAIVKEFQKKYDNIKYIRTEQRETIYKAWNRAIKAASGRYITNANTDDRHNEDALEKMAAALENNPDKVLVYADHINLKDVNGQMVPDGEMVMGDFSRDRLFAGNCPPDSQPMWRRNVHGLFGYFDEAFAISGDYELWFRLTQKYDFLYLNQILGKRFITHENVSLNNPTLLNWENEMVIRKCYEYARQQSITVGPEGISEHPLFSTWPEINIWKQKALARFTGKLPHPLENIKNSWDYRTNQTPKLTIVIVAWKRQAQLLENLNALNKQTEKNFEVIVLDNNGDLSELQSCADKFVYGLCGIELKCNLGPSSARNIGIEFAKANYIAFLDDDTIAEKHMVANIVEHFETYNISGLRGKVLPKNENNSENTPVYYDLGDRIIPSCSVSDLSAFRKDILLKVGGFDADFFGYEGIELSYRICKAQNEKLKSIMYFPDVIVYHDHCMEGLACDEKTLRQKWMSLWVWRKEPGIKGYFEHTRSLYPENKDRINNDYAWVLNVAIYLEKDFPEQAVDWAEKAVALEPDRIEGYYTLATLYMKLSRFDQAQLSFEKILNPLQNALAKGNVKLFGSRFEAGINATECYLSVCTQLAQCYTKHQEFSKLKHIYTLLLDNPHLTIPQQQKADIHALLSKLENVKFQPIAPEKPKQLASPVNPVAVSSPAVRIWPTAPNQQIDKQLQQYEALIADKLGDLADVPLLDKSRDAVTMFQQSCPICKDDDRYLVSTIISTYNAEKFIRGCLDDLENQTIADRLEIIVVNSGSQENEEEIIRRYQNKYDNIVYIKTEQREGIYTAWNRAVEIARGKFLTNANTDDRHREDALEIMANMLLANPDVALVYADQICTDTINATFANHNVKEQTTRPDYTPQRLLFGNCTGSQPMWRKSLHNDLGYFDDTLTCAGDWDFWLRIAGKYKLAHIPEFLGLYYHNELGIEHGRKIHSLYERYIVGKRYGNPYISVIPLYQSMDNPLVSVIMPAYNAADYIAGAIESVLIQNYRNFEFIVINDGSTDNTDDIVLAFKDEKIRYFRQHNAGLAATHNAGIKKSNGAFLIKLDHDDLLTPDFIARHLQAFEQHPEADLVYCDDLLIDELDKPIRVIQRPQYSDRKSLIRDTFRCGFPVVPFRTCIRRSVFDKIGLFDETLLIAEDYDMMRRFIKHGLKIHHLNEPVYLRRMTSHSLSRNHTPEKAKCHFDVVRRFTDTFSYDELFPDVDWTKIAPGRRPLHAKCLAAITLLAIGRAYIESNSLLYAQTAFDLACSELSSCLKMDPANQQLKQLLQKSRNIKADYCRMVLQPVG